MIPSNIWFHQGTAIYPTKINPILRLPAGYSSSDLKAIVWPDYKLEDWHYVLIRLYKNSPGRKRLPRSSRSCIAVAGGCIGRLDNCLSSIVARREAIDLIHATWISPNWNFPVLLHEIVTRANSCQSLRAKNDRKAERMPFV